jgi:hypothetical protein
VIRIGKPFRLWLEGTQAWYDNLHAAEPDPFWAEIAAARERADGSIRLTASPENLERVRFYAGCLADAASTGELEDLPELNSARAALRAVDQAERSSAFGEPAPIRKKS